MLTFPLHNAALDLKGKPPEELPHGLLAIPPEVRELVERERVAQIVVDGPELDDVVQFGFEAGGFDVDGYILHSWLRIKEGHRLCYTFHTAT